MQKHCPVSIGREPQSGIDLTCLRKCTLYMDAIHRYILIARETTSESKEV